MSGRAETKAIIPGMVALSVGPADMPHPEHWVQVRLQDVARLESGHTPSRKHPEWWGGEVPWISIPDARENDGRTIIETRANTNHDGLANSAARLLPAGTVCLSRTASVGYSVVMGRPMATSQDFVNWVCSEAVEPHWLKLLFHAEKQSLIQRFGKGTVHTTVYYPEVKAFHVYLPPMKEQRRIVAKIDALQVRSLRAREAMDAIPALLNRFRQSVLAAAFRGDLTADWRAMHPDVEPASGLLARIRVERKARWIEADAEKARARAEAKAIKTGKPWGPEDDAKLLERARKKAEAKYKEPEPVDPEAEGLSVLPEGWIWISLGDLCDIKHGYAFKSRHFTPDGPIVLTPGNFTSDGKLDFASKRVVRQASPVDEEWRLKNGDLLVVMTDLSQKKLILGATVVLEHHEQVLHNQRIGLIQPLTREVAGHFLRLAMLRPAFKRHVDNTSTGTLIQHTSPTRLLAGRVPLPPKREQVLLVGMVRELLEGMSRVALGAVEDAAGQIDTLDHAILAKAFRGELVPQDPNDEPASVLLERIKAEREASGSKKTSSGRRSR